MDLFYTRISKNNYDQILKHDMTPAEMIDFLENGALCRTFQDVLMGVNPDGDDLFRRLSQGLAEINGTDYSNTERKVRNWFTGTNYPKNREQLFQICFVLGLDEPQADRLLASASEYGIHYRNPREIIYAFALRNGMSWQEAQKLQAEMEPVYLSEMQKANKSYEKKLKKAGREAFSERLYTSQLLNIFGGVWEKEELVDFLSEYSVQFGEIHESAYQKFRELLDVLQNPGVGERGYSVHEVVDAYLRMNIPNTKKTGGMTYLQKLVKKSWPTESEIEKMKNRSLDVSRKAMLLLLLVTEDFEYNTEFENNREESERDIYYEDLIEEDPMVRLEVRLKKIDLFLDQYGMNLLDPGNLFDCLVLYALRMQYADAPASERMEHALKVLFNDEDQQPIS